MMERKNAISPSTESRKACSPARSPGSEAVIEGEEGGEGPSTLWPTTSAEALFGHELRF